MLRRITLLSSALLLAPLALPASARADGFATKLRDSLRSTWSKTLTDGVRPSGKLEVDASRPIGERLATRTTQQGAALKEVAAGWYKVAGRELAYRPAVLKSRVDPETAQFQTLVINHEGPMIAFRNGYGDERTRPLTDKDYQAFSKVISWNQVNVALQRHMRSTDFAAVPGVKAQRAALGSYADAHPTAASAVKQQLSAWDAGDRQAASVERWRSEQVAKENEAYRKAAEQRRSDEREVYLARQKTLWGTAVNWLKYN